MGLQQCIACMAWHALAWQALAGLLGQHEPPTHLRLRQAPLRRYARRRHRAQIRRSTSLSVSSSPPFPPPGLSGPEGGLSLIHI